jgi:hypothetical protein
MSEEKKESTGTVICHDWTEGRKAPVTVSKLTGGLDIGAYVGRQELAVYLCSLPFFFLALLTRGYWWPLLSSNLNATGTIIGSLLILFGPAFAVGMLVSMKNIKTRDLPRLLLTFQSSVPKPSITATYKRSYRRRNVTTILPDRRDND